MADVISFDDRKAALEGQAPAASTAFSTPEPEESEKASCMQAAGALAMACAEWSLILMHSPSPQGIALLAEARLLVRDLLLLGGVAPPHIGDLPAPTPTELAVRIRLMNERAHALGVLLQAPPR